VDLALTNWEVGKAEKDGQKDGIKEYDHEIKDDSVVREPDEAPLMYIMRRLDKMQEQINLLNERFK
jgi:hypothetical protein